MKMQKGFTLFELLVSISIIAILTALATVSYANAQQKARNAKRMEDMKMIQNAAEMYYSQNSYTYPTGILTSDWTPVGGTALLQKFPSDPKGSTYTQYSFSGVGGGALNGRDYCACAYMEGQTGNSDANCNGYTTGTTWYCVRNQQ